MNGGRVMKEKIKNIISEVKNEGDLVNKINDTTDIINEVGMDSLQVINFILRVEEEFDVEIDFEEFDLDHLSSLSTFCNYLSKHT